MFRLQFHFLLLLLPFKLCVQQPNYVFPHITVKEGLASDQMYSIFQDSKGYYWLGTESGLQKFDRKNFSNILSVNGNKALG